MSAPRTLSFRLLSPLSTAAEQPRLVRSSRSNRQRAASADGEEDQSPERSEHAVPDYQSLCSAGAAIGVPAVR
jgi:hypothetical protein